MESGRRRVRRMQLEPIEVMDVTWNFTVDDYVTFRDFFIDDLEHGSLFFVMETIEPADTLGFFTRFTRSYAFLDGTYVFSESDNLFTVNAALEVDEEEQEEFPERHVSTTAADGATASVSFHDGEILPTPELAASSAGFYSGAHFLASVSLPPQGDEGRSTIGFLDGVYLLTVTTSTQLEDTSAVAGFQDGAYTLVVMDSTQTETTSTLGGFLSGEYIQTVTPSTQEENTSSSAGFLSGAYTLA